MIVTEKIELNGIEYIRNYSDEGFYIERDGVNYGEAIDPVYSNRVYQETDIPIDSESFGEEITGDELLQMIEEVL